MIILVQPLSPTHPGLPALLRLAVGHPTPEKIEQGVKMYAQEGYYLLGLFNHEELKGCISLCAKGHDGTITHIAVLRSYQRHAVGRRLIQDAISYFQLNALKSETDEDARGFYERAGFTCTPVQGNYSVRFNAGE